MLEGHPISKTRCMYALIGLVDCEGDIRSCECEVLERPDDAAVGRRVNGCMRLGD